MVQKLAIKIPKFGTEEQEKLGFPNFAGSWIRPILISENGTLLGTPDGKQVRLQSRGQLMVSLNQ